MKKRVRIMLIINVFVISGLIAAALIVLLLMGRRVDVHTDKSVDGLSEELQEVFYLATFFESVKKPVDKFGEV